MTPRPWPWRGIFCTATFATNRRWRRSHWSARAEDQRQQTVEAEANAVLPCQLLTVEAEAEQAAQNLSDPLVDLKGGGLFQRLDAFEDAGSRFCWGQPARAAPHVFILVVIEIKVFPGDPFQAALEEAHQIAYPRAIQPSVVMLNRLNSSVWVTSANRVSPRGVPQPHVAACCKARNEGAGASQELLDGAQRALHTGRELCGGHDARQLRGRLGKAADVVDGHHWQ